jgi:competence protein ComEC
MPFGLEVIPLTVMGWAIDFMDTIGSFAAHLPGGTGLVGRIHPWSNALEIIGLCWLCLWHRPWRLLGGLPMLLALMLAPFADRPDILIGPNALPVAVRAGDGQLKVLGAKQNRFTVANWLTADAAPNAPADPRASIDPHLGDGWACDTLGCVFTLPPAGADPPRRIAVVTNAQAFDEDCLRADIVVTRLVAPPECAETALVFDRTRLAATGAVALTFKPPVRSMPEAMPTRSTTGPIEPDDAEHRQLLNVRMAVSLPDRSRPWMPPLEPDQSLVSPIAAPAAPNQLSAPARVEKASPTGIVLNPTDIPDLPDP